jgi:acylphosphatase
MRTFADANSVVGSVRKSKSGGIEGRVQADSDNLEAMKSWMESKGTVEDWEEALKHPFKEFKIV